MVVKLNKKRRAFENTQGDMGLLFDMIKKIKRIIPDPTGLGSFLELAASHLAP
jgi:hypothetical protein